MQYFVENLEEESAQFVSIRGSANVQRMPSKMPEYLQSNNKKLGVFVHKGFDEDTYLLHFTKISTKQNPQFHCPQSLSRSARLKNHNVLADCLKES